MILKMILKSFEFQCDFDFQITSKMIWILILNHLYLGDLILILKSSTYDDFAHLCLTSSSVACWRRVRLARRLLRGRMIEEIVRSQAPNKVLMATPPLVDPAELLPRSYHSALSQLRSDYC